MSRLLGGDEGGEKIKSFSYPTLWAGSLTLNLGEAVDLAGPEFDEDLSGKDNRFFKVHLKGKLKKCHSELRQRRDQNDINAVPSVFQQSLEGNTSDFPLQVIFQSSRSSSRNSVYL
jgi:hypothetical protein